MNRLDQLIQYLLDEEPQYSEIQIPSDLQGKRDLFRALRNVRTPAPVSEEFLRLQDEELQEQMQEKGVVTVDDIIADGKGELFSDSVIHSTYFVTCPLKKKVLILPSEI